MTSAWDIEFVVGYVFMKVMVIPLIVLGPLFVFRYFILRDK